MPVQRRCPDPNLSGSPANAPPLPQQILSLLPLLV
jgi:hypothetical protein